MSVVFPDPCDDAVRVRIENIRRVAAYNVERRECGQQPIRWGIGVNTDRVMVDVVGVPNRMEGGALLDKVNLTARVDGLTKL